MTRHFKISTFSILGPDLPKNIKMLLFTVLIFVIVWGIIEPFIPLYIKSISPSYTFVGLIFAALNIFIFFASVPIGDLVDKAKPEKLIKIAFVFYAILGPLYGFAGKIADLVFARSIHGVANPVLWVSTEAYIRKNTNKQNNLKAFGWYSTMSNLGVVIGTIIAAIIFTYFAIEINALFFLLVPFSMASLLIFMKIKPEPNTEETKCEGIQQAIGEVIQKDKIYEKEIKDFLGLGKIAILLAIIVLFNSIIMHVIYFLLPLMSEDINLGFAGLALLYGLLHVPFMFCFALAGLADKKGKTKIILAGLLLAAIVSAMLFFSTGIIEIFAILCLALAFVMALIIPSVNSLISDITPNAEIGEITGIYYAMYYLGGTIGPIAFGIIGDLYGLKTVFLTTAGIAVLVFLIAFKFRKNLVVPKIIIIPDKKSTLRIILDEAKTP
ncbi:MAG: MFS transporter [Candidatus ainarchaeum sp.]|nr:MFS transporter [Candidatus ainarchaeum sp.]